MELAFPRTLEPGVITGVVARAVDRMLAEIPPDRRGEVSVNVTLRGLEASAAVTVARGLEAGAWYARARDGQQDGGMRVRWRF